MTEITPEVQPEVVSEPTPAPNPVAEAAKKVTVKDLLASIKAGGGLKILKERPVDLTLPSGEGVVAITVRELTKAQYDKLLEITSKDMPEVPMIEQKYTQARRDPLTGQVKPAGSYFEPNPSDPSYIQATQQWFNDCAVLFGLFASAEDFGLNLALTGEELEKHIEEQIATISDNFPTPTLLDIAYEASLVNRGIPIAEQLIGAVEAHRAAQALAEAESDLPIGMTD
jgi:hypothetical protein